MDKSVTFSSVFKQQCWTSANKWHIPCPVPGVELLTQGFKAAQGRVRGVEFVILIENASLLPCQF